MGKKFYNKKQEYEFQDKLAAEKHPGRPIKYTEELAEKVCKTIASTPKSTFDLIREFDFFPGYSTMMRWCDDYPSFREMYERAKLEQVHAHIVFTNHIADDVVNKLETCEATKATAFVSAAKLRIESRQWQASRLLPRYYSDKAREEEANQIREELTKEILTEKLAGLFSGVEERIKKVKKK